MHLQLNKLLPATAWLFTPSTQIFPQSHAEISNKLSPRKPPVNFHKPVDKTLTDSKAFYQKSCGLEIPTNAGWDAGIKDNFTTWAYESFDAFISSEQKTFPQFLRNKFAPNAVPSSHYCDGIGSCTVSIAVVLLPSRASIPLPTVLGNEAK